MSTTKTILGITIVTVLILAGYAAWASSQSSTSTKSTSTTTTAVTTPAATTPTTTQAATTPNAKPTVITYTNGVFSPDSVTINSGDQVQFLNTDTSKSVNVASDPHPTHTDLPILNIGVIGVGQSSAAVTLTKTGTFGYHNHLSSSQKGTIIVK